MSDFPLRPLGELADINPKTTLPKGVEYPFVAMEDLTPGLRYAWSKQQRQLAGGARFQGGDTLFARITPCLENGKIAQYDPEAQPSFGSTEFIVLRAKGGVADPAYIHYLALSEDVRGPAISSMSGASGRQRADAKVIAQTLVPAPNLPTQRRIAAILGTYDDLIEVNRRRIAVLEEMARGLFEEWFVRFRFPGHEAVSILDTPDGPLPEGWAFAPLDSFVVLQRGFDLPKSNRVDGSIPVFSASGFHGRHNEPKVSGPGLVTGRSGTIGQVHLVMEDFWPLNTTLYVREFRRAGPAYGLFLLRHMNLAKHNSGAAVPTLNRNHIHDIKMAAAPQSLIDQFESFAFASLQFIRVIEKQNERLTASRDILLPRLISGQLSVAEVEHELEEAA